MAAGEGTGATRLVEALELLGVDVVFGLPGVHNLPIWRALADCTVRLIGVRHEQAAVYAADGYARVTGRLGVALVTTGPGAANTLGATGEAMASGSPVLVIATDIPSDLRRPGVYRGVLHETRDQGAMFQPVVKGTEVVESPDDIAPAVQRCGVAACEAPSGPLYLGIPTDLLVAPAAWSTAVSAHDEPVASRVPAPQLEAAAAMLNAASSPLIWAGGGALRADAGTEIGELAVRLGAGVVTTYMGRGLLPPGHPCLAPGPVHAPEIGQLWDDADVVLAIGTDFDGMMTQNWAMPAPCRLIAINVDAEDASKNYVPELVLEGDARAVTAALLGHLPARSAPRSGLADRLAGAGERVREAIEHDDVEAAALLRTMRTVVPADVPIVADMCVAGYWLGAFHPVPLPRMLAYPVGWGTLGFGFPAALGAAAQGGRTLCVCGDGGFLFACGELATAAQERLPVTVLLVDDGGYGMLRFDQTHAGDEPFGVDLSTPDFVGLATAFGIPAARFEGFGPALEDRLAASLRGSGPELIVVGAALKPPPNTSPRWYRRRLAPASKP